VTEIYQDFGGVAELHAQLVSGQRAIETTLDTIEQQVAPLVATWESDARDRYLATQERWNKAEAGLIQVLHDIGRAVSNGNDNMRDVERLNEARFGG